MAASVRIKKAKAVAAEYFRKKQLTSAMLSTKLSGPNSKGEYHYWESDKWFYIDKRGASLPQFSVMEWIPTQVVDDKENRQYQIGFIGLARWFYLPYDNSNDWIIVKIKEAIENISMIEVTLLNTNTIIDVQHSYKERPNSLLINNPSL